MYLELRRKKYHALHDIPKDVRAKLGKNKFCASLQTGDRKIAERRAALLEVRWKAEIERARKGGDSGIEADAAYWNTVLKTAESEAERQAILGLISDEANARWEKVAAKANLEDGEYQTFDPPEVRKFYEVATGERWKLTEHLDEWLNTLDNTAKSLDQKRTSITKFAERFPYPQDVTRGEVQKWVTALGTEQSKKPDTISRYLSELRGYWGYLIALEKIRPEVRPFDHLKVPRPPRTSVQNDKRKPFTPQEVVDLLAEAEAKRMTKLADLIRLGMWTGARIEELCALKVNDVHDGYFEIVDAKTKAGIRKVPIHPKLKNTMHRLTTDSSDGYVLPDLSPNKYGDRSPAIGHAFGRLKEKQGFGPQFVFHSIRKTVITLLENALVPENVAMDIVGHEKPSITYGTYSGGASIEVMRKAIAKIKYP